jgi:catechol 2,3-dioxygenase-like lactoylglutathione lyase family enzyme
MRPGRFLYVIFMLLRVILLDMLQNTKAFPVFSAPDIAAVKKFYGEVLGLTVRDEMGGIEVELPGSGLPLFIYPSSDYHAPEHTVLNFMVSDIDKTVDELAAKGVKLEQYPDFHTDEKGISRDMGMEKGPKAIAWFKDPADHILALIQE